MPPLDAVAACQRLPCRRRCTMLAQVPHAAHGKRLAEQPVLVRFSLLLLNPVGHSSRVERALRTLTQLLDTTASRQLADNRLWPCSSISHGSVHTLFLSQYTDYSRGSPQVRFRGARHC